MDCAVASSVVSCCELSALASAGQFKRVKRNACNARAGAKLRLTNHIWVILELRGWCPRMGGVLHSAPTLLSFAPFPTLPSTPHTHHPSAVGRTWTFCCFPHTCFANRFLPHLPGVGPEGCGAAGHAAHPVSSRPPGPARRALTELPLPRLLPLP